MIEIKGDLIKRNNNWKIIYSFLNSGRIVEITPDEVYVETLEEIMEKMNEQSKTFFKDVTFVLDDHGKVIAGSYPKELTEQYNIDVKDEIEIDFSQVKDCDSKSNPGFTNEEGMIMSLLVEAHRLYIELDAKNPSDLPEWVFHLHGMQRILGQRILRREYPNTFPIYKKEKHD